MPDATSILRPQNYMLAVNNLESSGLFAMSGSNWSIGVWCNTISPSQETKCEIHVNYWRVSGLKHNGDKKKTMKSDLLDIGLLMSHIDKIESINIFIPFSLTHEAISDLGGLFLNTSLAQGVFNENLSAESPPSSSSSGIKWVDLKSSNKIFCRVNVFSQKISEDIDVGNFSESEHKGTIIKIKKEIMDRIKGHGTDNNGNFYFRLRIALPKDGENPFFGSVVPGDRHLLSGFEVVEFIDFRINEARTLPDKIDAFIQKCFVENKVRLGNTTFLAALPSHCNLTVDNQQSVKFRRLENKIWDPYIEGGAPKNMTVYHWKKPNPAEENGAFYDFSAFMKIHVRKANWLTLIVYTIFVIILSVIGSFLASMLFGAIYPATPCSGNSTLPVAPTRVSPTAATHVPVADPPAREEGVANRLEHPLKPPSKSD